MKIQNAGRLIFIFVMVVTMAVMFVALWGINADSGGKNTDAIVQVINKSLLQCYALEGSYPEDLNYLAANYGIIINDDLYYYHYEPYGANIFPIVKVLQK